MDVRLDRIQAAARIFVDVVGIAIHDVSVITRAAHERVEHCAATVQAVRTGITDEEVSRSIAGCIEVAAALQSQHVNIQAKRPRDRGLDGVPTRVGSLGQDVARVIDPIDIIAVTARHRVGTRTPVQSVVAGIADEHVATGQAIQGVAAATSGQRIGCSRSNQPVHKARIDFLLDACCIPDRSIGEADLADHAVSAGVEIALREDLVRGSKDAQFQPSEPRVLPIGRTSSNDVRWQDTGLELDRAVDAKCAVGDRFDNILPVASAEVDDVCTVQIVQRIVPSASIESVHAVVAAAQGVCPFSTLQRVVAILAFKDVVACAALQGIVSDSAIQDVVAVTTRQDVACAHSIDGVVPVTSI